MKKTISTILLGAVALWLLPLGAYIRPTQEKNACGGKRAFHMCSMRAQNCERRAGNASISAAPAAQPAAESSAASSTDAASSVRDAANRPQSVRRAPEGPGLIRAASKPAPFERPPIRVFSL